MRCGSGAGWWGPRARSLGISDHFPSVSLLPGPPCETRRASAPMSDGVGCGVSWGEVSAGAEPGAGRAAGWGLGRPLRGCAAILGSRQEAGRACGSCVGCRPGVGISEPQAQPRPAGSSSPRLRVVLGHGLWAGQETVPRLQRSRAPGGEGGEACGVPAVTRRGLLRVPPVSVHPGIDCLPGAQRLLGFSSGLPLVLRRAEHPPRSAHLPIGVPGAWAGCLVGKQQMPAPSRVH